MTSPEKKNRFSCITRLNIHHQLENHRKEVFSTKLHWKIFCCITAYDYSFQKESWSCDIARIEDGRERCQYLSLHEFCVSFHLYSLLKLVLFFIKPKLNFFFQRRRLRKSCELAKCNSDDLLSISE